MFPGRYEHVYISGNPYINSKDAGPMPKETGWVPTEHFPRIVDVWDFGWESVDGVETVPPWSVAEEAIKWQMKEYKTVIHFMQPHAPYIADVKLNVGSWYDARMEVLVGRPIPPIKMEVPSLDLVRKAYLGNLKLVLEYALEVVDGRTVILSDHGELLGEMGRIGHPTDVEHEKLYEVPLEVMV